MRIKFFLLLALSSILLLNCSKSNGTTGGEPNPPVDTTTIPPATTNDTITSWITKADQSSLLIKQPTAKFLTAGTGTTITVDSATSYQTIDGFGYTLTGGSASVINTLDATTKSNLLQELFGNSSTSIGISYLRISIGASDLNASVFSYDDVAGDTTLSHFSLAPDKTDLIPLLKEIVAINPNIKILATPWSAPTWMKDNGNSVGGNLLPQYYNVYASYFVKYIQAMKAEGLTIDAVTPQNEPLNPGNNPSMVMDPNTESSFIENSLGPAFKANTITTKIICYDHNCDRPDYAETVLANDATNDYVDGSAFHLYAGDIIALSSVHSAYPNKNLYFTEQYTSSTGSFNGDFLWHMKNVVIGSMNNWSKTALEWNLANNANYEPHTDGGCTECKGALTISGNVTRNVGYYIIAQISKFVSAGSVRVSSSAVSGLYNVAFVTPQGKKVLVVLNDGSSAVSFNIKYKTEFFPTTMAGGSAATYVW
jgi:glucosylceramidase